MAKIYRITRGCVVLVGLGLISACTGPLAASAPDPALAPEIYIQKYSSSVVTEQLPQGGTTASAMMVNDKAVVQSINISVFPADKLPRLIPGEGGTPVDIAKIGDQTMAYQTTDTTNKNPQTMLDFTKGNIQVHLSAYSIAGGNVPVGDLVKLAQEIEKSLPGQLPVQSLALTPENADQTLLGKTIKNVVVGKQSAVGASEVEAASVFSTLDASHCLQFVFNQPPEHITLALYDEQQHIYLTKLTSTLNSEEAKKLQMTRCINRSGLAAGHYHLGVWVDSSFVAGYPFEVK